MNIRMVFMLCLLAWAGIATANEESTNQRWGDAYTLWYDEPAEKWVEALPLGNGRLGAMVFGGVESERLQLNEISLWSGRYQEPHEQNNMDAHKHLPELRKLMLNGEYIKAQELATRYFTHDNAEGNPKDYGSVQTLGDLTFEFNYPDGEIHNYRRWLDIEEAIAGVSFKIDSVTYQREYFASNPDELLGMRLSASGKGQISFTLDLSRVIWAETTAESDNTLVMRGTASAFTPEFAEQHPELISGIGEEGFSIEGPQPEDLEFEAQVHLKITGGDIQKEGNQLVITGADEAELYLFAETDYALDFENRFKGEDPHVKIQRQLAQSMGRSYQEIRERHVEDYQSLFSRVKFDVEPTDPAGYPATNDRIPKGLEGLKDQSMVELLFDFGRYLMIASSRDERVPLHSQGIWSDAIVAPWFGDYKSNINFEMFYWMAEIANLSECHVPMLNLIQMLPKPGAATAKAYFDSPGWTYSFTTNIWGMTGPGTKTGWGTDFSVSGWVCKHLWDHYAFTGDVDYLREAYPTMRGAAEFYLHAMVPDNDGYLVMIPTNSAENAFVHNGRHLTVVPGSTYSRSIIDELFRNVIAASEILGIDDEFREQLVEVKGKIRPPQIGSQGQILEWNEEFEEVNAQHRHLSHLFAMHPGTTLSPLRTPELADAVRQTLAIRGDEGTGWSLAWKINLYARLLDGDYAYRIASRLIRQPDTGGGRGGVYPNLFDVHPPFQIDGNLGYVSGIIEMLLQSHLQEGDAYVLHLLPALPSIWPQGSITGIRARGGFEVDLVWEDHVLKEYTVHSLNGNPAVIRIGEETQLIQLKKGETRTFELKGQ